jgi:hypothetical protein
MQCKNKIEFIYLHHVGDQGIDKRIELKFTLKILGLGNGLDSFGSG